MTSRDYWKRRSLRLAQMMQDRAEETVRQISRIYGNAQRQICWEIEAVFRSFRKQGKGLTEGEALELLSLRDSQAVRDSLLEQWRAAPPGPVKDDLWRRLAAPAYAGRISRLQALRDQVYIQARTLGLAEVTLVRDRLADVLEQSYYRQTFDIQQAAGAEYDFARLDDNTIRATLAGDWEGGNWSGRIWNNNQAFADAVEETVAVGLLSGMRYQEMADALLSVIGMDPDSGARYRSARLIRTECAYVQGQGVLMGYQAAEIEYYRYLATLDGRTSTVCRGLDMQRFPVSQAQVGTNYPPMHPHCRSTTMPDMSRAQMRKIRRMARDPVTGKISRVAGDMSYHEWYAQHVTQQQTS